MRPEKARRIEDVIARYAVAVSPELLALIDPTDPLDPIARQFLPAIEELETTPHERSDPIGDEAHSPVRAIVHRHPDRVLFKVVASCPVYCRFCFRRETIGPGREHALSHAALETAFGYIASKSQIREVILTGGDPLILSARRIAAISSRLGAIAHVKVIRWHTRVPLTDPTRVSAPLVEALQSGTAGVWVAIHANHAREFTGGARAAIARLREAGLGLVSQSVLLKGVNDSVHALCDLMHAFAENGIKPYYLHHPDLSPGTSHFRLDIAQGLELVRQLRCVISGLEMPTYMLDIPGGFGKIPLESAKLSKTESGYRICDLSGRWHDYPAIHIPDAAPSLPSRLK